MLVRCGILNQKTEREREFCYLSLPYGVLTQRCVSMDKHQSASQALVCVREDVEGRVGSGRAIRAYDWLVKRTQTSFHVLHEKKAFMVAGFKKKKKKKI